VLFVLLVAYKVIAVLLTRRLLGRRAAHRLRT